MTPRYDDAVAELYQAPHGTFVTERKRLAAALKAAGDKASAARLGKLPRPSISAWAINQLWWHAREAFEAMLETAERLRAGDLKAAAAHREAIAKLRGRALTILADAGHATSESTLRRVTTTLSAIAASGGFGPDPDGALFVDRDPPGFEAVGIATAAPDAEDVDDDPEDQTAGAAAATSPDAARTLQDRRDAAAEHRRQQAEEERARAEAAAERKRLEEARARRQAERHRLESAQRAAQAEIEARTRECDRLRKQLTNLEESVLQAQATLDDIRTRLAELAEPEG